MQQGPVANVNVTYPKSIYETVPGIFKNSPITKERDTSFNHIDTKIKAGSLRLKLKSAEARQYLAANNFKTGVCFIVDMPIPSGNNRFFVNNFIKDEVEFTSLVSHGTGSWKPNCNEQLFFPVKTTTMPIPSDATGSVNPIKGPMDYPINFMAWTVPIILPFNVRWFCIQTVM